MPTSDGKLRKARIGRPSGATNLTPLRRKVIVAAIAAGNHYETAAAAAGIPVDTLHHWIEKGRKLNPGGYIDFAREVEQAEAESEAKAVALVQKHAQGFTKTIKRTTRGPDGETTTIEEIEESDWRAAMALLERRFGFRWALARKMQFSGALDMRQHIILHTDPKDMERIIEAEDGVLLLEGKNGERSVLDEGPESDPPGSG